MSFGVTFKVKGLDEIVKALETIETKLAKQILREELREACKVVAEAERAEVPVDSAQLQRLIKVRAGKYRKGHIRFEVQIHRGEDDKWYASTIQYGSPKRGRDANPFGTRAADKTLPMLAETVPQAIWHAIQYYTKGG